MTFTKVFSLWHWVQRQWDYKVSKKFNGRSITEWVQFWKDYCVDDAYKGIRNHTLSQESIHGCLRHMPIRGYVKGWPEEVYALTDLCVQELYEYSKAEGFIPNSYSIEDFVVSHGFKTNDDETAK